jgi:DnaJ-class molecular chaperone
MTNRDKNEVSITVRGLEQVTCVMEALRKAGFTTKATQAAQREATSVEGQICPRCEGTGRYCRFPGQEKDCAVCEGTGRIAEPTSMRISGESSPRLDDHIEGSAPQMVKTRAIPR